MGFTTKGYTLWVIANLWVMISKFQPRNWTDQSIMMGYKGIWVSGMSYEEFNCTVPIFRAVVREAQELRFSKKSGFALVALVVTTIELSNPPDE